MSRNKKIIILAIIVVSITVIGFSIWRSVFYNYESSIPQKEAEEKIPEDNFPEISWNEYINHDLGFSMKIPQKVNGLYKCSSPQKFTVPLKVFEDNENRVVYLTPEYYYEANWDTKLLEFTGECKKITYSLESLKSETFETDPSFPSLNLKSNKPWLGWAVITKTVNNENELGATIKEMLGSGCVYDKENWKQAGVYDIEIGEEDAAGTVTPENTTCPVWRYSYRALYYPDGYKFFFIKLGQECTFSNDYNEPKSYQCYDEEMVNSFKFE